jgi:hypothetical protein
MAVAQGDAVVVRGDRQGADEHREERRKAAAVPVKLAPDRDGTHRL